MYNITSKEQHRKYFDDLSDAILTRMKQRLVNPYKRSLLYYFSKESKLGEIITLEPQYGSSAHTTLWDTDLNTTESSVPSSLSYGDNKHTVRFNIRDIDQMQESGTVYSTEPVLSLELESLYQRIIEQAILLRSNPVESISLSEERVASQEHPEIISSLMKHIFRADYDTIFAADYRLDSILKWSWPMWDAHHSVGFVPGEGKKASFYLLRKHSMVYHWAVESKPYYSLHEPVLEIIFYGRLVPRKV